MMIGKYLLLFVVVIFQHCYSSADDRDRYYVVDRGLALNAIRKPYRFQKNIQMNNIQGQRVKIQLYYESLCPDCRNFDSGEFKNTVIALAPYLDINVYPYGNAETEVHNGHIEFKCQHGPAECYGNKLHACAIDTLQNSTLAVLYNSCLMDPGHAGDGSDDRAADLCGQVMRINSAPIKQCAKSDRGTILLKYYGEESKKAKFNSVPYILLNGVQNSGDHFMQDVCKAIASPPPACNGLY